MTPFERQSLQPLDRLTATEYAIWGANGDNGLMGHHKTLSAQIEADRSARKANEAHLRRLTFYGMLILIVLLTVALVAGRDAVLDILMGLAKKAIGL